MEEKAVPPFFRELMRRGCLDAGEIRAASDGFYAAAKSLADILVGQGITTFPNDRDELRDCDKFFDDWYCYAVPRQGGYVYSLFKLREQEFDAKNGLIADGDTPGVTVSFIAFDTEVLAQCLSEPTAANRKRLNQEMGMSILFISHNLHVVRKLCTRVAVMEKGRIVETGPVDQIFFHPQVPYTQRLIAAIPTRRKL